MSEVPYQVEQLITNLLNKRENIHIRQNYRGRLDVLRDIINKAISKYDEELFASNQPVQKKRKRA